MMIPLVLISCVIPAAIHCDKPVSPPKAEGTLTISYTINPSLSGEPESPHFSVVIWLEDKRGNYVRTLALGEWLSDNGYDYENFKDVCKTWGSKSNWATTTEPVDAITRASGKEGELGNLGQHTVEVELSELGIDQGTYVCNMEVGVRSERNILCTAEIAVASEEVEETPTPYYVPEPVEEIGMVLGNVSILYTP